MNNKTLIKDIVIFLAGATIGGVGTWLVTKTHYKNFADQEIAEVKDYYRKKIHDELLTEEGFEEATGESVEEYKDEIEAKREMAKKNRNKPNIVDYTKFYNHDQEKPTIESSLAEMEHPKDSDEDELYAEDNLEAVSEEEEFSEPDSEADDHEEENYIAGERMNKEDEENSSRDPLVISEDIFYAEDNRFSQESLFYYTENDTLVDENDTVVENRELIVGNWLSDPIWDDSGVMYVRNPRLQIDYEITKVDAAFSLD